MRIEEKTSNHFFLQPVWEWPVVSRRLPEDVQRRLATKRQPETRSDFWNLGVK
jgi:hypothetical protein